MDPLNLLQLREKEKGWKGEWRCAKRVENRERDTEGKRGGEEEGSRGGGKGRKREREEERFKEPPGYKTLCFVTSENIGMCITTPLTFCLFILVFFIYFMHLKILKHQKEGTFFDVPLLPRFTTHSSVFKQKP